jgi:hypothetical protein
MINITTIRNAIADVWDATHHRLKVGVPAPVTADILTGKFNSVDGSSGTLLTIPAGRVWRGWLTLNATGSVAQGAAAIGSHVTVQLSGSGTPTPATATVLLDVFIAVPSQTAATAGTTGLCVSNRDSQYVTLFADASNALLVTVTKNSVTSFAATAFGELIA